MLLGAPPSSSRQRQRFKQILHRLFSILAALRPRQHTYHRETSSHGRHRSSVNQFSTPASSIMTASPSPRTAFNLKVLRRHDASIVTIIDTASFVVLYNYNQGEWTKTGVEGPLFLFRRRLPPYNGFFLMNRNGVENFSADVTPEDDLEITPEFIIYRPETSNEVYGIWVFEASQRMSVGDKLLKLQQMVEGPSEDEVRAAEESETKTTVVEGESKPAVAATAGQKSGKESEAKAGKAKANGKPKRGAKQAPGKSNDEESSARATPVPSSDATAEETTQINLDDLFGTPAAPAPSTAEASTQRSSSPAPAPAAAEPNGTSLLDSLFAKASLDTSIPVEPSKPASADTDHSQNLLALLGGTNAASPTKPSSNPSTESTAPTRPSPDKQPQPVPAPVPASASASAPCSTQTAPKMSELLQQATRDRIGSGDDGKPLSRREFVTELLSMIHTNPEFVTELYEAYLARVS